MTRKKYTYEYPKADVTVDCVLFGFSWTSGLSVLLIRRKEEPYKGCWALPGGFIELPSETAEEAARRELLEETGIKVNYLEQLKTFDAPGRDPRGRVISIAHYALVRSQDYKPKGGSDAIEAGWISLPAISGMRFAFDHVKILDAAVKRLQAKVRYEPIGFSLLPVLFTLSDLQKLYEGILLRPLDKRNFRKRILATGVLKESPLDRETRGRPAKLYRFNKEANTKSFNFEI